MSRKSNTVTATETAPETTTEIVQVVKAEIKDDLAELTANLKTKSAIVRYLSAQGHDRGRIAKFMNIRYQHVRNILVTPLKKG